MVQTDKTPGLKVIRRPTGRLEPRWVATREAVAQGYAPKTVNLSAWSSDESEVIRRCRQLQGEMLRWLARKGRRRRVYDGTIGALIDLYETHEESSFRALKHRTQLTYGIYLKRLKATVGKRRVAELIPLDVKRWHRTWIEPDEPDGRPKLGAGAMALAVLKAVLSFGHVLGFNECGVLHAGVMKLRLPSPRPRTGRPTADQVTALRKAAHARGRASIALASALQFETIARQWDVIGQWVPLSAPVLSDVATAAEKWVGGLRWEMIGQDQVLRLTPTKTEGTTAKEVAIDLNLCPMVLEEIALVPAKRRRGPMIVSEATGRPWIYERYRRAFRKAASDAGWPASLWSRDMRAGGLTEGREGGASLDDAASAAGHGSTQTTRRVYDRDVLEASRRVQQARLQRRAKNVE